MRTGSRLRRRIQATRLQLCVPGGLSAALASALRGSWPRRLAVCAWSVLCSVAAASPGPGGNGERHLRFQDGLGLVLSGELVLSPFDSEGGLRHFRGIAPDARACWPCGVVIPCSVAAASRWGCPERASFTFGSDPPVTVQTACHRDTVGPGAVAQLAPCMHPFAASAGPRPTQGPELTWEEGADRMASGGGRSTPSGAAGTPRVISQEPHGQAGGEA